MKLKNSLNQFSDGPNELWHWLSSQKNKELKTFCVDKNLESTFDKSAIEKNSFVKGPFFVHKMAALSNFKVNSIQKISQMAMEDFRFKKSIINQSTIQKL